MIIVTSHAYDRFKERFGLNKKSADRMAEKAYYEGINHNETNGRLFKYISSITYKNMIKNNDIKLYGDIVYCFIRDNEKIKLCTVYGVPHNLLDTTHKKQRRKKNNGNTSS